MTMFLEQIHGIAQYYPVILKGIGVTLALSFIGIVAGTLIGFVLGIGRASSHKLLSLVVGAYTDIFRGTPVLVQVFVVFFILPEAGIELDSFTAGALALSNIAACFISEIVASGIRAVPIGQVEAAASAGLTRLQQLRLVVMPQATRMIVPSLVGQFVLLVKDSSVVSAIGLLDLTRSGWIIVQSVPNGMLVFSVVGIGYFLICYPLLHLSRRMEKT
ncbi:Amino acid ABC transporter, permease protein, 3-TM region, His/Glu/Gln/Arg/opine [Rhodoferax ferrireducens T118]|jgi:polar amino acid transport system permease protein|uniref:Amino acid ABC transporter, permease protein, 3-TM region, His/Glu/Gln/Arg/opine n=2 Tax=Rhodoferax ferrireducens TaxID=192843 RepID=Q222Q8_ALBFT|nr:Amino acid ABC transporter, permease protein, 3-TM region, His/Glu/Gln/Arg/opine [Rhodoferax ferrireducens T118]